uniref:Transcription elongation factor n=1 Tax=Malurus cyaneus samueli TaxID=2593467 RepID=A0A8C5T4A6_9PASS
MSLHPSNQAGSNPAPHGGSPWSWVHVAGDTWELVSAAGTIEIPGRRMRKREDRGKEGALDLLKSLTSYTMTIQLLQTTRIGVAVNSVRKHCSDEEVVASAKILIKNWKRLLGELTPLPKDPGMSLQWCQDPATCLSLSMCPHRTNSSKAKPETPRTPTSPSFFPSPCCLAPCYLTGDSVRDKCIEMLTATLRMDGEQFWGCWTPDWATPHIFQELKSTDMKYRNRVRSRISNLKDPKNPSLRRNVLCGAIEPSLIARMTAEEMASDELKKLRNAMTQEAIREHQMAKTGGTVTDLFQCGKCKKKNCTYNQVQTRSADEPMTTFVLCNECGNRWKVCNQLGRGSGQPNPFLAFRDGRAP